MPCRAWTYVLGVVDAVHDQLPDVVAGKLIKNLNALTPCCH
jgi:hypothetical protein